MKGKNKRVTRPTSTKLALLLHLQKKAFCTLNMLDGVVEDLRDLAKHENSHLPGTVAYKNYKKAKSKAQYLIQSIGKDICFGIVSNSPIDEGGPTPETLQKQLDERIEYAVKTGDSCED